MGKCLSAFGMGFISACLLGCGASEPGKVTATGQLLKKGQPLRIGNQVFTQMVFYPQPETKDVKTYNTYSAMLNPDGSFAVADIPPGKYLIALELIGDAGDLCSGLFKKDNSKLIRDVTGKGSIQIDITKPKGE